MKVFDNIEIFHRGKGANGEAVAVSDEEFQRGLTTIVEAVIPCRLDKKEIISIYKKTRDELPLTEEIAEKESSSSRGFSVGQKAVDLAVLKVIYEDRYSFGYLYWTLVQKYENEPVEIDRFVDPEAPYKKGLIEYAVKYDLTNTVEEYESRSSLDDRYEYILGCLRRSQGEVLIKHQIKDDYEAAVSLLAEECRTRINEIDVSVAEVISNSATEKESDLEGESPNSPEEGLDSVFVRRRVIKKKYAKDLMAYLHENMAGQTGENALVYIRAAMDAGLLSRPPLKEAKNEFGDEIGEKSNYSALVSQGRFNEEGDRLSRLTEELKKMFP